MKSDRQVGGISGDADIRRAAAVPGWLVAGGTSPPVRAVARHGLSAAACMSDAAALWLQGGRRCLVNRLG